MDWNVSCRDCWYVFNWVYRVFVVLTYPVLCNCYVNNKFDKTLLLLEKSTCTQNGGSAKLKLIAPVKLYKLLFIVNQ